MGVEAIARRYANALADVVITSGNAEEIKSELSEWQQMIRSNGNLNTAFANPSIAQSSKVSVLESLIDRSQPSKTTANFLRVLLRNSRLTALPEITEKLAEVLEDRAGRISGTVVSARELSEEEKASFETNLNANTGKSVSLTFAVDPDLIGGAVTRVGSTVFDGTIKSQLEHLRENMIRS